MIDNKSEDELWDDIKEGLKALQTIVDKYKNNHDSFGEELTIGLTYTNTDKQWYFSIPISPGSNVNIVSNENGNLDLFVLNLKHSLEKIPKRDI